MLARMQVVLICGWQDTPFMLELLSDLDRGNNKLPRGSEVTLMNLHPGEEIARHIKRLGRCRIAIRHIEANPLHRESFQKVAITLGQICTHFNIKDLLHCDSCKGVGSFSARQSAHH